MCRAPDEECQGRNSGVVVSKSKASSGSSRTTLDKKAASVDPGDRNEVEAPASPKTQRATSC